MTDKPHLTLVPYKAPTYKQRVRAKIKAMPKPDGMLFCPFCGGRGVLSITAGVIIKDGKRQRGTSIIKDVCADCWKHDRIHFMTAGNPPPEAVK
ncbi:MAG: hypothetical protein CMK71_02555 [Pseudomonadaceae bacterium]|nr:hypothetical protein [Pseudomonadaceae bacterium]|tara:strand:- start:723 stop:1004 length:282 start_codon:yes stop_codon:yes gene_type:complete